jgi:hypothetical protein
MHDLLIRNALLLDGTGSAPVRGDLAVTQDRISGVGEIKDPARDTLNADGLALMPGIIDNHTHYDAQLTWDPLASPSPALGVTTAIIGNCGFTIAPCRPADRDLILKNLTQVEGMSIDVLRAGTRWDFESVPEFFGMLERQGVALNVACFVGHSSVRTYVMGEDAPRRAATAAEVARMRDLVLEGMRAGAVGFATSTSPNHNGHGGIPMPSRLADEQELRARVGCLKEAGRGVFMLTKGGQTRIEFLEEWRRPPPAGGDRRRCRTTQPRSVFDDLERIAANGAAAGCSARCLLPAHHGLHAAFAHVFEGLTAWKPALSQKNKSRKTNFEIRIRKSGDSTPAGVRSSTASGTRCMWKTSAGPRTPSGSSRRWPTWRAQPAPIRWTPCSISPSPRTWTPSSARCCSIRTRPRSARCCATRMHWFPCRMRART